MTLPLWAGREFTAQAGAQTRPTELIIRLTRGADPASVVALIAPGSQVISHPASNTYLIRVANRLLANASGDFARNQSVEFVEPNHIRRRTGGLPALNDPSANLQWAISTVRAALAWNIIPNRYLTSATAGSGRIRVAVLDTGGDCTHNDFKNSGGASVDAVFGGQLSMALGRAFIATTIASPACAWQDDHGHGTHVLGIVAAATQNALGVASLGYPIELVAYKVLDSSGSGDDFTISSAIRAAADAGIPIVSMSLGGSGYSQSLQNAINYAWQKNTLVIAAAGNSNSNALFYPAGANYAIAVAATDSSNNKASFSNFGPAVDIAAPGVGIYSTAPSYPTPLGIQNYGYLSGTSMATPHVSAIAGLVGMTTPNFSAASLAQRIQQSAASSISGGGWDQNFGYGIIDAYQAVTGALRPATLGGIVGQVTDAGGLPISGATVLAGGSSVTTVSDGLYRIQNLTAGSYPLTVSAPGFLSKNLTAVVAAGADTTLAVAMGVATGSFTGTVTTSGVAAAGTIIQAIASGLIMGTALSDSNGLYVLAVPAGSYDIRVSGISRVTTTLASKTVSAGANTTVNLTVPKMGVIAGTVRDANSNPVANAQLSFSQSGFTAGAVTDGNGFYTSIGLPSGTYTLSASASVTGSVSTTIAGVVVSADSVTTVNPQVSQVVVTVSPGSVNLTSNQTQQFTATVTGTSDTGVTWLINPVVGTILNGLYTAPANITVPQSVTVTATSVADTSKFASATANLNPPTGGSGQSLAMTPGGTAVQVTPPPAAPYSAVLDFRFETRLHNWTAPGGPGWVTVFGNAWSVLRFDPNAYLHFTSTAAVDGIDIALNVSGRTDFVVRAQRNTAGRTLALEVWNTDGTAYAVATGGLGPTPPPINFSAGGGVNIGDSIANYRMAYFRWYSTATALAGAPPSNGSSNGDLADWEFEGNLLDSSPRGLNLFGTASYAPTPVP